MSTNWPPTIHSDLVTDIVLPRWAIVTIGVIIIVFIATLIFKKARGK